MHEEACAVDARVDLREGQDAISTGDADSYFWRGAARIRCSMYPGSSGSALYSSSRRAVIGLVNTGLENEPIGSGPDAAALRPACAADRPCEIDADGGARLVEANYAVDLRSLAGCFDATGAFSATGPTCGLPRSGP
jgi:hypothetical protein